MRLGPFARAASATCLAWGVLWALLSVRAVLDARVHRQRAEIAIRAGDLDGAVVDLRRAARSYAVFNPDASFALATLQRIANEARTRGDAPLALTALRAMHAAIHAGRSFYTPEPDQLARVDREIAALMVEARAPELDVGRSNAERARSLAAALEATRPREAWVATALTGFAVWIAGAVTFLAYGLDAEGRLVRQPGVRAGFAVVVGWVAFALGLHFA